MSKPKRAHLVWLHLFAFKVAGYHKVEPRASRVWRAIVALHPDQKTPYYTVKSNMLPAEKLNRKNGSDRRTKELLNDALTPPAKLNLVGYCWQQGREWR